MHTTSTVLFAAHQQDEHDPTTTSTKIVRPLLLTTNYITRLGVARRHGDHRRGERGGHDALTLTLTLTRPLTDPI